MNIFHWNIINSQQFSFFKRKLLTSLLTKKQLNDEKAAVGSGFKKIKPKKPEEVVRSKSPEVIPILDDSDSESAGSESAMNDMNDLLDLNCVTCRQMDSSANNQLFECTQCNQLFHQLCHIPKISNETNLNSWVCSTCKGKKEGSQQGSIKSTKSYESSSSSSSSSSRIKPSINIVSADKKKAEATKRKGKESSSSSSSRSRSSKK